MTQSDFYSFDNLSDYFAKKLHTDDNVPVDFRKVRCFKFTADNPNVIYVKDTLNGDFQPITTSKTGANSSIQVPSLDAQILRKYDEAIPLKPNKTKSLLKLLPFIPTQHTDFYNELLNQANRNTEDDPLDCTDDFYVEDI